MAGGEAVAVQAFSSSVQRDFIKTVIKFSSSRPLIFDVPTSRIG